MIQVYYSFLGHREIYSVRCDYFCGIDVQRTAGGSEALADGDLNYKLDTSHMVWSFKEHGENLNSIGEGISAAVEQRMKSEHLKTELITKCVP